MPIMRTTSEILDAVRAKTGAPSDYALRLYLGVTRQQISKYRNGHDVLSDDVAIRIAEILEVEPLLVLATVHAERSRSETAKKTWTGIIDKLGGTAAAVALGIMLNALPPLQPTASAAEQVQHNNAPNIHYTKRRRRNRGILSNMVEQLMQRPRLA
jgi:transcriptional regulator with XRE-family HTH domain